MKPLQIHKFGGTSVADASCMAKVCARIREAARDHPVVVVVSALAGVTDLLCKAADAAARGNREAALQVCEKLQDLHRAVLSEIDPADKAAAAEIDRLCVELRDLARGALLVGEMSLRTRDRFLSLGEKLSVRLLSLALVRSGPAALPIDADGFLETDNRFGNASPLGPVADRTIQAALGPHLKEGRIPVVTGFIGRAPDGATTTLGRGGSDLTATLIASAMDAAGVTIWTDVDGVYSADPGIVQDARVIPHLNYREAAEVSFYGAKVLHQHAMIPVASRNIRVLTRNTFKSDHPGTVIDGRFTPGSHPVKAITAIRGHALVSMEGKGMAGVPGISARVFEGLAERGISVTMISQSNSESTICLAVPQDQAETVEIVLKRVFRSELSRGDVEEIVLHRKVALLAVVGLGMARTPGIAARVFSALGDERVNVLAIAQGSSELNISLAVHEDDTDAALRTLHRAFGLHRLDTGEDQPDSLDLILLGFGKVAGALCGLVRDRADSMISRFGFPARIVGAADRSGYVFSPTGFSAEEIDAFRKAKAAGAPLARQEKGKPGKATDLVRRATGYRLSRPVLVDVTDAKDSAEAISLALEEGCDAATANKVPLGEELKTFRNLFGCAESAGRLLRAEATVGAGLPILDTLHMLLQAGDRLVSMEGCLSGTLTFLMSKLEKGASFSDAVEEAVRNGYTEPDPVVDLLGTDVQRKAVILGRLSNLASSEEPGPAEGLVPGDFAGLEWSALKKKLRTLDDPMAKRVAAAKKAGKVLRYVARIGQGTVTVGPAEVPAEGPLGQLRGTDNMLVIHSERYDPRPLVISGPGAGVDVTAMGILSDILHIAAERR